jgi:ribonuclease HII
MVDEKTIDEINILQATFRAMEQAANQLNIKPDYILVDGNKLPALSVPAKAVVHGDSLSASIAAASVLAKVTRDDFMLEQAKQYPEYGFDIHKGYGTKAHTAAILEHGPCAIHRTTFLKKLYGTK